MELIVQLSDEITTNSCSSFVLLGMHDLYNSICIIDATVSNLLLIANNLNITERLLKKA